MTNRDLCEHLRVRYKVNDVFAIPFLAVLLFHKEYKQTGLNQLYIENDSEFSDTFNARALGELSSFPLLDSPNASLPTYDFPTEEMLLEFLHAAAHLKILNSNGLKNAWINEAVTYALKGGLDQLVHPDSNPHRFRLLSCLGPFLSAYDSLIPEEY